MKIDRIYINTHRYDLFYTRICLASVRFWYPDIPISLIVDQSNGSFIYGSLLSKWKVEVLDTNNRKYGWGLGKFEPLFLKKKERFLVMDADTVMIGPVLNKIERNSTDFVVDQEVQPTSEFRKLYYDDEQLAKLFPDFTYPGYSFNTGQWAATTGKFSLDDLTGLVEWGERPRLVYPNIFKQADQGLLNFLVHQKESRNQISVAKVPLMIWPPAVKGFAVSKEQLAGKQIDDPFIIHWAGIKFNRSSSFPLLDIILFYEHYFYTTYPSLVKMRDRLLDLYLRYEKKIKHKLKKKVG